MNLPLNPTLDEHGGELESAEKRHADFPKFTIPPREERDSLVYGSRVQLLLNFINTENGRKIVDCEKMWVTIKSVTSHDSYTAHLDNMPVTFSLLSPGDIVSFSAEHICSVLIPRMDPRHPAYKPAGNP